MTDAESVPVREKAPLERRLPPLHAPVSPDLLLEAFLAYVEERGLSLYPAQEEAILELFAGRNVILNTPTGSGKSLVALAACFKALAENQVAFYTAPIKALVSEKFFELCRVLGPQNVGMLTGDATVNRDAPVVCCTAEILANLALREGTRADVAWVVMDEFHYYSDRDRGVAWQLPLLTLPQARFLLMSATLGDTTFFEQALTKLNGVETALVKATERPVPLDFEYSETPLQQEIQDLLKEGRAPIYIVHFSQRAASEQAQNLMSLDFLEKDQKQAIREELRGFRFDSPFGRELARFIPHGIGVHHAGMLPKYRRLVERLAQRGHLKIICGTDTLGVGVNVPIRTVLFTQLCKYDGEKTSILAVRDFQQIAGRAGRRGYDTRGSVVVQAPEHEIENKQARIKAGGDAKKLRKIHPKKPPEKGFLAWNAETLERLRSSSPEPLASSFSVSHGMLLNVLSRGAGGCQAMKQLIRGCHEPKRQQRRLGKEAFELFRSLLDAGVIELVPGGARVNADLQQDFSLNQALGLYLVEAVAALRPEEPDYALVVLSLVEAILEQPWTILRRQVDVLKTRKMAELKGAGVEYEERMAELEKIDYEKPEKELIWSTFETFSKHQRWVIGYHVHPKSIARDMYESASSFNDYVKEYGLQRAEGVLLRYLTDVYRTLDQTVPEAAKSEELRAILDWLFAELRATDASLIDEWERLKNPELALQSEREQPEPEDLLRDEKAFTILLRNSVWRFLQALARRQYERAIDVLIDLSGGRASPLKPPRDQVDEVWTGERLERELADFHAEYGELRTDPKARHPRHGTVEKSARVWRFRQTLVDAEEHLEWALLWEIDLDFVRETQTVALSLLAIERGAAS